MSVVSIAPDGQVRCVYSERLDLSGLGAMSIDRASNVEPVDGEWFADLSPVGGPVLGPFPLTRRSDAIAAEVAWIEDNVL